MGRIVFFALLAFAVYVGWRLWRARQGGTAAGAASAARGAEAMVRCDVCGLNVPQSEALAAPGSDPKRWYCGEAHLREADRGR